MLHAEVGVSDGDVPYDAHRLPAGTDGAGRFRCGTRGSRTITHGSSGCGTFAPGHLRNEGHSEYSAQGNAGLVLAGGARSHQGRAGGDSSCRWYSEYSLRYSRKIGEELLERFGHGTRTIGINRAPRSSGQRRARCGAARRGASRAHRRGPSRPTVPSQLPPARRSAAEQRVHMCGRCAVRMHAREHARTRCAAARPCRPTSSGSAWSFRWRTPTRCGGVGKPR